MKIVVVGGNGLIGSKLVAILSRAGHDVVAASPRSGIDVISGEGLGETLKGVSMIVDVTNGAYGRSLVPGDEAELGEIRFDEWLGRTAPIAERSRQPATEAASMTRPVRLKENEIRISEVPPG